MKYSVIGLVLLALAGLQPRVMASEGVILDIPTKAFAKAYFIPNDKLRKLRAYLIFSQGEIHNPGTEGLAHYIEHLALSNFKSAAGSSPHSNAFTSLFATGYWLEFDKRDYTDRLTELLSVTSAWTLDKNFMLEERGVIEQEYNTRFLEDPYLSSNQERARALFGDSGYARSLIGTPELIRQFDLDEAVQLHQRSHQLENATLIIAGDSSLAEIDGWLKALDLPIIEPPAEIGVFPAIELSLAVDERELSSSSIPQSSFYYDKLVEYDGCASNAHCDALFNIIGSVIDSSLPGGIADALRYDNFIARHYRFMLYAQTDSIVRVGFGAQPDAGISLDTLQEAFIDAWSVSASDGLPAASIEKVRERLIGTIDKISDKPAHTLSMVLNQLMSGRAIYSPQEQLSALRSVQYEDIENLLKSLHGEGRVVVRRMEKAEN